jgi:hypothetical protein
MPTKDNQKRNIDKKSKKEKTSKKEKSPLKEKTSKKDKSPLKEETPKKDKSPLREKIPKKDKSPLREKIPKKDKSPLREKTPKKDKSPLKEKTPKKDKSPLKDEISKKDKSPLGNHKKFKVLKKKADSEDEDSFDELSSNCSFDSDIHEEIIFEDDKERYESMSVYELKNELKSKGIAINGKKEKPDLIDRLLNGVPDSKPITGNFFSNMKQIPYVKVSVQTLADDIKRFGKQITEDPGDFCFWTDANIKKKLIECELLTTGTRFDRVKRLQRHKIQQDFLKLHHPELIL